MKKSDSNESVKDSSDATETKKGKVVLEPNLSEFRFPNSRHRLIGRVKDVILVIVTFVGLWIYYFVWGWETFGTVIIATLAAVITVWQIREYIRRRLLESTNSIMNMLDGDENQNDRLFIYSKITADLNLLKDKTSDEYIVTRRVLTKLARIALMLQKGLLEESTVMEVYHEAFIKLWYKLEKHVKDRQKEYGAHYIHYVSYLIQRSWRWHKKYYKGVEIHVAN